MPEVIFFSIPAYGHINPTLSVAKELVNRNKKVIYYSTENFRKIIESTGAQFRCYQDVNDIISAFTSGRRFDNRDISLVTACLLEMCIRMIPTLMEELQADRPACIINDSMCLWGKILGSKLDIPLIASISTFAFNKKVYRVPLRFILRAVQSFLSFPGKLARIISLLTVLNKQYGFKIPGLMQSMMLNGEINIVYTSRYFQPYSEMFNDSYKFIGPSIPSRSLEEHTPLDIPEDKSVIYICLGTLYNKSIAFYRMCIEAFKNTDYLVIMAVGYSIDILSFKEVPANFIIRNFVPQIEILQQTDLFISHGGMNSVSEAIFYGVPMIIEPVAVDQPILAKRMEELGASIYLKGKTSPAKLRKIAEDIISGNKYRENIIKIQQSFLLAGGYQKAADEILAFMRHKGF